MPSLRSMIRGFMLGLGVLSADPTRAAGWERVGAEAPLPGAPEVLETRFVSTRPPGGASDRVQVHRYRAVEGARGADARAAEAVLLYLPGTYMNGVVAVADADRNVWLHLARNGVEVYALDYRTHFVSPELGADSLSFMEDWTLETFVADAQAAAGLAREESGSAALFVAGFSRGVTLAWGLVCVEPRSGLAGIVVFDGTFKSHAPSATFDFAAAREKLAASGEWATDVAGRIGWEVRRGLMVAAGRDPGGPATDPKFETVGEQVASILYHAWSPGALADPIHGVSRVPILARLLEGYDRYWPAIQNAGGRAISDRGDDPRTPIDDCWGELDLPVLYFGATNMGPGWILDGVYTAVESGSDDVTLHVLEGYGHLDVLIGEQSRQHVFEPTLRWIRERAVHR